MIGVKGKGNRHIPADRAQVTRRIVYIILEGLLFCLSSSIIPTRIDCPNAQTTHTGGQRLFASLLCHEYCGYELRPVDGTVRISLPGGGSKLSAWAGCAWMTAPDI
jgi:hypothetical protein